MPLSTLNLSVRARKCISRLGLTTVGELIQKTPDELLSNRNFGVTSLNEIRRQARRDQSEAAKRLDSAAIAQVRGSRGDRIAVKVSRRFRLARTQRRTNRPMRGKLVFFILLLAAGGIFAGWRISHDPQCFIGSRGSSAELAAVPRHRRIPFSRRGARLPDRPRPSARLRSRSTSPTPFDRRRRAAAGPRRISRDDCRFAYGERISHRQTRDCRGHALEIEAERSAGNLGRRPSVSRPRAAGATRAEKDVVLNVVRLEDYIASVVDGEMPAAFPEAAGKPRRSWPARTLSFQMQANRANQALRRVRHNAQPELSGLSIPRTRRPAFRGRVPLQPPAGRRDGGHGMPGGRKAVLHVLHGRLRRPHGQRIGRVQRSGGGRSSR